MDLDDIIIRGKRFVQIADAAEMIGGSYHNSNSPRKLINKWACKGYLRGIVVKKKGLLYVKSDWVNEFAKTRKYMIKEGARILGLNEDTMYSKAKFSDDDERKLRLEKFPSGVRYITDTEIERQFKVMGRDKIPKGRPGTDRSYTNYEKWRILNSGNFKKQA